MNFLSKHTLSYLNISKLRQQHYIEVTLFVTSLYPSEDLSATFNLNTENT